MRYEFETEYTIQIYVNTGFAYECDVYGVDIESACAAAIKVFYYALDCKGMRADIDLFESDIITACVLDS